MFEKELKPVFEKATECGLNLWDTAAVYGDGTSERILGNFVKDVCQKSVILSTKFTPQIAGSSPDAMQEMINGSKECLHTDVIDVYWIHNPMDVEKWALTGRYNEENPFPEGTGRGEAYNPHLKELTALIDELKMIGTRFDASPAQVATAWAIAKGTLPIIGVTKVHQVEEAAKAAQIELTADEISRLEKLGGENGSKEKRDQLRNF